MAIFPHFAAIHARAFGNIVVILQRVVVCSSKTATRNMITLKHNI